MTLNASGPISLAGATTGQSIAVELGVGTTTQISLNCTNVRTLAGVASGAIVMPTNFWGKSSGPPPFGCATYTSAGTYSFVVPSGYTKICVVCVGGGGGGSGWCICNGTNNKPQGGGGGALSYTNCIPVTPGETLTVVVGSGGTNGSVYGCCTVCPPISPTAGGDSYINRGATTLILAKGGLAGVYGALTSGGGGAAACGVGAVKYSGGSKGGTYGAGGGAAGYAGNGGTGASSTTYTGIAVQATAGSGGGGGGGGQLNQKRTSSKNFNTWQSGGGGVGLVVQGANGAAGTSYYRSSSTATSPASTSGSPGSGGIYRCYAGGTANTYGGVYGGGGGNGFSCSSGTPNGGGYGGIRIIYGGTSKTYPNNSAP